MLKMDRLNNMSVYIKAVELGSFAAAAEALTMSPQLVGKCVSSLEQHLGVRLINRTTRHHSLTEAGRHFYERAKIILAEVEAAESFAQEVRITPRGHLKINAPVSFGVNALSHLLPVYLQQYPDVTLELTLSNRMVDLIDEGYDAVFRVGELADSGLMAKSLAPYKLLTCAAPTYLARSPALNTPEDLARHDCLIFTYTSLRNQWIFEGKEGRITVPVSGRLRIDSGEALIKSAIAGSGVVMQPSELVAPYIASGELVRVLPNYHVPKRPLNILYAPDRRTTPKLRSFLDFFTEKLGAIRV